MRWHDVGPTFVTLALAIAGYMFVRRYGGGAALSELERANRVLERRVTEQDKTIAAQAAELLVLRSRTDVTQALAPVLIALELHESRASERTERTLNLLDLMAHRLGPDPNGA